MERPADLGLGAQELPWSGSATIADVLDDAVADARAAVAELAAQLPERAAEFAERLEWCRYHEAWDVDRRAARSLDGLGLAGIAHDRTLGSLSGGQRSRVGLAALLVRRPDALLLDEPSNHLDDDAAAFLEEARRALPGVVVLASHDRAFLDAVCTDVVDLDQALDGPTRHGGGHTAYLAERHAARDRWAERYAAEQDELAELRTSVAVTAREVAPGRPRGNQPKMFYGFKRGRVQSQVSRRVRNARRRLDELDRDQVRRPPEPLRFDGKLGAAASGPAVALRGIRVAGRLELAAMDVGATDRVLVTGANGSGKSTVLAWRLRAQGRCTGGVGCGSGCSPSTSTSPTRTAPRGTTTGNARFRCATSA